MLTSFFIMCTINLSTKQRVVVKMKIEDVKVDSQYLYKKSKDVVKVLRIDTETKNVYIRNTKLLDGWYTQDGWTHVKNIEEI